MVSDWEKLADRLGGQVQVARVDATRERVLADAWGVEGFPTLKLIARGKVYTYQGPRTADKLEPWARSGYRGDFADALPGENDTDVVVLTGNTFEEHIVSDLDTAWFVLFFVPTCEHCKNMAGDFQDFASRASLRERNVRVAKVNSEKEQELSAKWVSVGFPTMKLFVGGKVATYHGDRNADAMEAWVLETLPNPSFLERLLKTRIYGLDPLLAVAFLLGLLVALVIWRIVGRGLCMAPLDKEVVAKKTT
jgi:protein disulfide-isomerase A6